MTLDDETTRKRNGLVEFEHLNQLWSHPPFAGEEGYPSKLHPIFLRLMERFDLSYKVVFDRSETSNTSLTAQPPSQEIGIEQFRYIVKDELNIIRQDLVILDRRDQARFQRLSQEQRTILSQVDQQFAELMQMLTDEAKDGPRLFSFQPVDPKFFDRPKWISAKFQLTLWCEHVRQPLPALNPNDKKKGVYELDLPREWFTKAVPYLRILTGTLSLVLPVAGSATKFILDETTYKAIEEQLDLGQKSIESTLKGSDMALAGKSKSDTSSRSRLNFARITRLIERKRS